MMKRMAWCGALVMSALAGCGPETGAGFDQITPVTTAATAPLSSMAEEAQIIALINSERSQRGYPELDYNGALSKAAQSHADDMAARGYFSHTSQSGASVGDRVRAAGYSFCFVSENLSIGYGTVQQALQGWMESSGHRANILSSKPYDIGIGLAAGGIRVAVFAKPC